MKTEHDILSKSDEKASDLHFTIVLTPKGILILDPLQTRIIEVPAKDN